MRRDSTARSTPAGSLGASMTDQNGTPAVTDGRTCAVVMLAQNEEQRIVPALTELRRHGFPVFVVDGGSNDATVSVAERLGATVLHRPFDNMSAQLNWGIEHLTTDFVLVVDADEVMSSELAGDIRNAITE